MHITGFCLCLPQNKLILKCYAVTFILLRPQSLYHRSLNKVGSMRFLFRSVICLGPCDCPLLQSVPESSFTPPSTSLFSIFPSEKSSLKPLSCFSLAQTHTWLYYSLPSNLFSPLVCVIFFSRHLAWLFPIAVVSSLHLSDSVALIISTSTFL